MSEGYRSWRTVTVEAYHTGNPDSKMSYTFRGSDCEISDEIDRIFNEFDKDTFNTIGVTEDVTGNVLHNAKMERRRKINEG